MRELGAEREGMPAGSRALGKLGGDFGGVDELHASAVARGSLQGDLEIDDLDLVLDERPGNPAVLPPPLHVPTRNAFPFTEKSGSPIGERVDHRRGPRGRKAVELSRGPVALT